MGGIGSLRQHRVFHSSLQPFITDNQTVCELKGNLSLYC